MESTSFKNQNLIIRILNYVSTAFAVVLLVMQFLPFWGCFQCSTCGDARVLSIMEYVWFANDHSDGLTAILKNYYIPGFMAMDVVGTSILIQLCSIGAVIISLLRPTKVSTAFLPMIAGLACVIGYFTPAYQLGQNWQMHVIFGAITLLCSLAAATVAFVQSYKKTKEKVLAELQQ